MVKTKPVTTNDKAAPPLDSVDTMESAVSSPAVSNVTDQDSCTVTINIAKGVAGRATDTIVLSEVKSISARKAHKRGEREREKDLAASGERLTKVTRVTSGVLASQGIYCLGKDLHCRVVTDLKRMKVDEAKAEHNWIA